MVSVQAGRVDEKPRGGVFLYKPIDFKHERPKQRLRV